jgi:RHS repeat-associated protein
MLKHPNQRMEMALERWLRVSVRSGIDANLDIVWSEHFAPYGEPFGEVGTDASVFGFTGEPTDENGLVYLRARYYNPILGVFPSLDPVEFVNRYGYVDGNPINLTDPSGKIKELPNLYDPCHRTSFNHDC